MSRRRGSPWLAFACALGAALVAVTGAAARTQTDGRALTTTLPTWRNHYDWQHGDGYVGWRSATSSTVDYGLQAGLGGQPGLWLWPRGGQKAYTPDDYAEWTYTAPGTTRLSTASLDFAYVNKLLAHHCIQLGFRDGRGAIVAERDFCKPVQPPDSQDDTHVFLVDPSANPTAKTLYFRVRVDCGGEATCARTIPTLDPLTTGAFVRLVDADLVLVDDDNPVLGVASSAVDTSADTYNASVTATDAGSGIKSMRIELLDTGATLAAADAPCDPTHHTPALDTRICPESFSLDASLDVSGYEDGTTLHFRATAVDVAGNVGVLEWRVTLDRVSLDIALRPLKLVPHDKYTSVEQNDYSWLAHETVPAAGVRQGFKWRVALAPDEHLALLSNGSVAIVDDTPGVDADTAEEDPAAAPDPNDGGGDDTFDPDAPVAEAPPAPDEGAGGDDPNDPNPGEQAALTDEAGALTLLDEAQSLVDGDVTAVLAPPVAKDAAGASVPVGYSVSGNLVTITIAHRGGSFAYPVEASALVVEDPAAGAPTNVAAFARSVAGCPRRSVVTFNPVGWESLFVALKANPESCTDYYIVVPAVAGDKMRLVEWEGQPRVSRRIVDKIAAAGPNFHAVAEFNWSSLTGWAKKYVEPRCPGINDHPCTNAFIQAGLEFRRRMACAGYRYWAIQEIPSGFRVNSPVTKANLKALVRALYAGARATCTTTDDPATNAADSAAARAKSPGIAFVNGYAQWTTQLPARKELLKHLLEDGSVWNVLHGRVFLLGWETYANCVYSCQNDLAKRRRYLNSFLEHPALLAFADTRPKDERQKTDAARRFLREAYFPFLTAFGPTSVAPGCTFAAPAKCNAYRTDLLNYDGLRATVSLQLHSTRFFAAAHAYPDSRVGVAWNQSYPDAKVPGEQYGQFAAYVTEAIKRYMLNEPICTIDDGFNGCTYVQPQGQLDVAWDIHRRWAP